MNKWLINGRADDRIPVSDRGFSYGDGLFETIAVRDGQPRFLDAHLKRLENGAERLAIPLPDRELLNAEISEISEACEYGTLKIILTRGPGTRGYAPPVHAEPMRLLGLLPGTPPASHCYTDGVVARYCSTPIGHNPATAGMKTLGRLEQVLARAEWSDAAIAEGLMSTAEGLVVCGTMSNVFLIRDGALVTPKLTTCGIRGIMRNLVIDSAERIGLKLHVCNVPRAAVDAADEVFVTNSLIGLWPVSRIGERSYPVGPVTRTLMKALADAGVSECAGQ